VFWRSETGVNPKPLSLFQDGGHWLEVGETLKGIRYGRERTSCAGKPAIAMGDALASIDRRIRWEM
jgi:hypothetical protein